MDSKFEELVTRLETNQGRNLVSVIVYGSAVAAPGNPKKSDYHILIITKRLAATNLRQARPVVRWWTGEGYSLPVFFTENEIDDSLDVYPIEFRHMKRAYRVLYGRDLLAGKEISKTSLRWQTEHELRGKLLRLRSLYLPASISTPELAKLMTQSVVSFVHFMRPILEMLGEEPPLGRLATVQRIGERLHIDTSPLSRILRLRDEPNELMDIEVQDLFAGYLDCLDRVIEAVDNM
ncbi:MAG: hypothetical protein L0226_09220 [Acidobacteria bacterium]|nr:hypothetical protein [Acidobacteriota bacterium]